MTKKRNPLYERFRGIWQKWLDVGKIIAYYNAKLLLGFMFYTILIPYGLVAKLLKKDILDLKMESNVSTYWKEKENKDKDYYKQY